MQMIYKQKPRKPLLSVFMLFQSLCVKCYVLVFKNKLLSQFHTTYHIHFVATSPQKEKPAAFAKPKNNFYY